MFKTQTVNKPKHCTNYKCTQSITNSKNAINTLDYEWKTSLYVLVIHEWIIGAFEKFIIMVNNTIATQLKNGISFDLQFGSTAYGRILKLNYPIIS